MPKFFKRLFRFSFYLTLWLVVPVALAIGALNFYYAKKIYDDIKQVPRAQAAIVLGASVLPDKNPSEMLTSRIDSAISLYEGMKVEKILLSGDHSDTYYNEVAAMRQYLVGHSNIARSSIIEDDFGVRTLDSIYRAKSVYHLQKITVVTQRFHLPRTLFLAHAAGLDAFGFAADRGGKVPFLLYVREVMAQILAMIDVWVFDTQPKFLDQPSL